MEFSTLLTARYSARAYRPDPVPQDVLARVLEAARLAPTAANRQPFGLVVFPTAGCEADLRRVYHRSWLAEAPLVLWLGGIPAQAWTRRDGKTYLDVDVAIVMTHLILAAAAEGLGTCVVAAFDPQAAREVFALPPEVEPILLTPLGDPADRAGAKERKPLNELVHWGRW